MTRRNHPAGTLPHITEQLIQQVHQEIAPRLTNSLAPWTPMEFSRINGLPRLRYLLNSQGQARHTLTRQTDGTLELQTATPGILLTQLQHQIHDLVSQQIHRMLLDNLHTQRTNRSRLARVLLSQAEAQTFHTSLKQTADSIALQTRAPSILPSGPRDLDKEQLDHTSTRLIRTYFTTPETLRLTRKVYSREPDSIISYNSTHLNIDTFAKVIGSTKGPQVLALFIDHVTPRERTLSPLSPTEIKETIRAALDLSEEEFKHLPSTLSLDHRANRQIPLDRIAEACRLLHRTGAPPPEHPAMQEGVIPNLFKYLALFQSPATSLQVTQALTNHYREEPPTADEAPSGPRSPSFPTLNSSRPTKASRPYPSTDNIESHQTSTRRAAVEGTHPHQN